jgi:hypothetical protein
MNGQLPLRAIRFLDDARQRGLLRQSGGSYEFRHRVIRDYLAGSAVAVPEARTGA